MQSNTALPSTKSRLAAILIPLALAAFVLLFTILIHRALNGTRIGADFYIFWRSGRAFLFEQTNPYSPGVTAQIQQDIYGRAPLPGEDHLAFAYPFYSLFGLLPALLLEYDWALSLWYALTVTAVLGMLLAVFPERGKFAALTALLLFPVAFGLVMGNFAIPVTLALLVFLGLVCLKGVRTTPVQVTAGILLAWATLKPQFVWLLLVFILLYALREKLVPFLAAFFSTAGLFVVLSFVLLPTWVTDWLGNVRAYAEYQRVSPVMVELLRFILPESAAQTAGTALVVALVLSAGYVLLRWWQGRVTWLQAAAWLGVVTFLAHPHGMSYEQLPSLIPMILWVARGARSRSPAVILFWSGAVVVSWLPLILGREIPALDRTPILWTAAWAAWFLTRKAPPVG